MNAYVGNPIIDTFFKYFTHVGDGIFAVFIGLIILIINIRKGIFVLSTYIISGLFTSLLKNYYYDVNRPHFVFDFFVQDAKVKYVEGVEMAGLNSFPSGHATSAFAVFTCLALLTDNWLLKFVFFILALTSAFSRTYLSQHWLVDITFGSMIGTVTATLFYFIFIRSEKMQKLDKPLFNFKRS